jgi:hypothetical protein
MKRLLSKLTYANVVATLCLFLVLGGGAAFAAGKLGKNTVGSKQLKANAVTAAKIKNGSISAAKIQNGAITGSKVSLGTLGTVPSATKATTADSATTAASAGNANTVNGRTISKVFVKIPKGSDLPIVTLGPYAFSAECSATGSVENFQITTNTENVSAQISADGNVGSFFEYISGEETVSLDKKGATDNGRGIATVTMAQSSGAQWTAILGFEDTTTFGVEATCVVQGEIIS